MRPKDILGATAGGLSHRRHRLPARVHRDSEAATGRHDERIRPFARTGPACLKRTS